MDIHKQAFALFTRNYLLKYQGMRMKYLWHVVMPSLPIILYNILSYLGVFAHEAGGIPRAVSISIGITYYYIFSESVVGLSSVLDINKNYIIKTGVSFSACYLSVIYATLANFIIRYIVVLFVLLFNREFIGFHIIYAIPYSIYPILLGSSLGLILSVFTVFYSDFTNFVQAITFYMLFGSGVFGAIDGTSTLERIVINSPTYIMVANARNVFVGPANFDLYKVCVWTLIAFVLCLVSVLGIRNSRYLVINYLR